MSADARKRVLQSNIDHWQGEIDRIQSEIDSRLAGDATESDRDIVAARDKIARYQDGIQGDRAELEVIADDQTLRARAASDRIEELRAEKAREEVETVVRDAKDTDEAIAALEQIAAGQ
ncbi:MAG: hypothetical protein ACPHCI_06135 [Solirubrobacterales bacterium]